MRTVAKALYACYVNYSLIIGTFSGTLISVSTNQNAALQTVGPKEDSEIHITYMTDIEVASL